MKFTFCKITVLMFIFCVAGLQQANSENFSAKSSTAKAKAPVSEKPNWQAELTPLTTGQRTVLEYWEENTTLPGPVLGELRTFNTQNTLAASPSAGTKSMKEQRVLAESATAEDVMIMRCRTVNGENILPNGSASNVMESSISVSGRYVFYTGNWFAARSTNSGFTWSYVNPYTDFGNFCCDQVTIYDESRFRMFWLRQGVPGTNPYTGNYENEFWISVSHNRGATFYTYKFKPTDVNPEWTNEWFDYPHMQIGADFLYITYNLFNQNSSWTRTMIFRLPLDSLADNKALNYSYFSATDWFTWVPIQGADHTMYWASNWPNSSPQNSRIRIYKWDEDSDVVSWATKDVPAWSFTRRGNALCGDSEGNWAARYDQRILTGAQYYIRNADMKIPGRKVIAWWWNVQEGGGFLNPYIDAAAFYEDTLTLVEGNQGRPFIWDSETCFAYPSAAANRRGDLGLVFHFSNGPEKNPSIGFAIVDDCIAAPPGFTYYAVRNSRARPTDEKWGDYNTVRLFGPCQNVWAAGSHYLPTAGNGTCCNAAEPVYFVFGRKRDQESWRRWKGK
ncbi:MAG: hypothetical protein E3K32_01870 [wastewater metagenome]|nr:hypothetical protein [Candidatus Loosdrechtia aerotolerans]